MFTSSEYGQANVILAVAHELLLLCEYEVHIASFKAFRSRINELNHSIPKNIHPAIPHRVSGMPITETLVAKNQFIEPYSPSIKGALSTYKITMPALANTWEGPEYIAGFKTCLSILCSVNPNLVVAEPLMCQGLEACETLNYKCVVLSPNTFQDMFRRRQSLPTQLLRIPAFSSAFAYPLPLSKIPANLYLSIMLPWSFHTSPEIKSFKKFRKSHDLPPLPPVFNIWNERHHYIFPSTPETDYPCHIPSNVISCGPITLPEAPISKKDPELFSWLKRGPTVLLNLGSYIAVDDTMADEIAFGLKILLHRIPGLQVLWKLKTKTETENGISSAQTPADRLKGIGIKGDSVHAISEEIANGRVRIVEWLGVDPLAVMKTGNIMCSVHHGGPNSFHEALSAGVPQVVVPCWLKNIDTANRVEWLGIGVYGSRSAAPSIEVGELFRSIMRVLGEGEQAVEVRQRARELATICNRYGGRKTVCDKIVEILESSLR